MLYGVALFRLISDVGFVWIMERVVSANWRCLVMVRRICLVNFVYSEMVGDFGEGVLTNPSLLAVSPRRVPSYACLIAVSLDFGEPCILQLGMVSVMLNLLNRRWLAHFGEAGSM